MMLFRTCFHVFHAVASPRHWMLGAFVAGVFIPTGPLQAQCSGDAASPSNIVCSESPDPVDDPDGFFTEDTIQSLTVNAGVLVNDQDEPDSGNVGGVILIGDPLFPVAPLPLGTLPAGSVLGDVLINGMIEDTGEISNALRLAGAVDGDLIVNGTISGGITGVWAGFRSNGSEITITGDLINNGTISGGNNAVQISTEFPGDISIGVGGDFINSGDILGDTDNDGIGDGVSDTLSTPTGTGGTSGTNTHGTIIGNFTNQEGATISGGNDGISLQRIDGNFTNAGDIIANPNDIRAFGIGLDLEDLGGNFLNTSTGSIDADFEGVSIENVVGNVENAGTIDASRAFDIDEIEGSFTNSGTIIGDVLVDVIGNGFDNSGSITDSGQAVTFQEISGGFVNSGSIESTSSTQDAIGSTGTGTINGGFVNEASGTISAADTGANLFSFINGDVINRGIITGDTDGSGRGAGFNILQINGNFANEAGAQITGETGLVLDFVQGQATNAGSITGNIAGDGDTDGAGVELDGTIEGGFFNQSGGEITGFIGVLEDNFAGGPDNVLINAGTITGTGGVAIDMGFGSDVLEIRNGSTINGDVINTQTLRLGGAQDFTFDVSQVSTQSDDSVQYRGVQAIEVGGSGTFTLNGSQTGIGTLDLDVVSGTAIVEGDISTGNTTVSGGTLGGTGTVGDLSLTGGSVAPGNSIGTLMVDGDFTQGPDGELQIEIGPTGSNDVIEITGTAAVDGTLDIILFDPFIAVGDTFTFLTADGGVLDGTFDTVNTPSGLDVMVNAGANEIDIEIVSLVLGGCVQTGSNVLCEGIDADGFSNTVDSTLDVLVESDALVVNPTGDGLELGESATVDVQGTVNAPDGAGVEVGVNSSVENSGTINGRGFGINAGLGGQVINAATGTITAESFAISIDGGPDGTGSATNHGEITATGFIGIGIGITGGATVINNGTIDATNAGISDFDGQGVTVTNNGMITGNDGGVQVRDDATVVNNVGGTITAAFSGIAAGGTNIEITNAGTVTSTGGSGIQLGTIGSYSINNSGSITGAQFGVRDGDNVTLTNEATGTIQAGSETMDVEGVGDAIRLGENAEVVNHGMISATEGDAIHAASGQISNSGTITATQPEGDRFDSFDAIAFSGDGTVINEATGVITADDESIDIDGAGTVTNHGMINGNGSLLVRVRGDSTIVNTGTIAQVDNNGDGIQTGSNTAITNEGSIITGSESVRIDDFSLDEGDPYTGTLDNSGDIIVDVDISDSEFAPASAIFISIDEGRTFSVENSGTIESGVNGPDGTDTTGQNAFGLSSGTHLELNNQAGGLVRGAERAVLASSFSTSSFSIENHGTITGRNGTAIEGAAKSDTVMNAGTINGDVLLLGGDDSFTKDVGTGVENGSVNGGIGEDDLGLTGTGNFDLGRIGTDILGFNSLDIRDGANVTATGTNADVGLVTVDGTSSLTLAAGSVLVAPLNVDVEAGGMLGGVGMIDGNLINDGTVAPGQSTGTLTIDGDFVQTIDGLLVIEIGPTGSSDLVDISGQADLDGTLDILLADPDVDVGDSFIFMTADGGFFDSSFDTIIGPDGVSIAVTRIANDLQIDVLAVTMGGCVQTGSNVLCTGIDGDGFKNTVDSGLDVLVQADAQVLHYTVGGSGLVLGDAAMVDNEGEVDAVFNGIVAGDGSAVVNRAGATINAGVNGVVTGTDSQVTNAGTISSGQLGVQAGTNATVVNSGTIAADLGSGVIIESGSVNNAVGGSITGDNVVLVTDGPGAVINSGSIVGDDFRGVQLDAGGTITNNEGATIEAEFAVLVDGAIGTVSNAGLIHGTSIEGISLRAGGSVNNSGTILADVGGDGIEVSGAEGTVTNSGLIDAEDNGIFLIAGGSVTNEVGGVIDGENGGVGGLQDITVINSGTIIGGDEAVEGTAVSVRGGSLTNNAGAMISGSFNGAATFAEPGTINNSGAIEARGGQLLSGSFDTIGRGVNLRAGGTVNNSGDISGPTAGIESFGAATIDNSGSISSFDSLDRDGLGISIRGGAGTVTNSGEIISGGRDIAIQFDQFTPFDDSVELQPGSVLMGSLLGGPGTDALLLTGETGSIGVLDLDASPVIDFETYDKNGDGTWQVTGDGTAMTGQFDVNSGTLNVDGNLENTSFDVMSGATLGGSGTVGDVTSQGMTSPGNSIGTLVVDGDFVQTSDGTLEIEFGPTGSTDLIEITGTATLDGTLDIILFDTNVQPGDVFTFLTADAGVLDGSFDVVSVPAGLTVEVTAGANQIDIEVLFLALGACEQTGSSVVCEGIDGDGFVNTAENGLDVFVEPDAMVLNPNGDGLVLADDNTVNNPGTINVAGDGIVAGDGNTITNTSNNTIMAGDDGIVVGDGNDILNTGTLTADDKGIVAGSNNNADLNGDGNEGIVNEGLIDSQVDGIFAGSNNKITNRGQIFARSADTMAGDVNTIPGGTALMQQGTGIGVGSNNEVINDTGGIITAFDAGIATSLTTGTGNMIINRGTIDTVTLSSSEDQTSDAGIRTGADNTVDNFGIINSRDTGISAGTGSTVTNHIGGQINVEKFGIDIQGGGTATNDGTITTSDPSFGTAGIRVFGDAAATNNGTINAAGAGMFDQDGGGGTFTNNGTINAGGAGFDLFQNANAINDETGVINATGGASSDAIVVAGGGNVITNRGELNSTGGSGIAVGQFVFGDTMIDNFGLIEGAASAIQGGPGSETVFNAGTINGDVLLAGGADSFATDVSTGSVNSMIDGGDDSDALVLLGTGSFDLSEQINFETLSVEQSASVTATGASNDVGTATIDGTSSLSVGAGATLVTSGGLTVQNGGVLSGTGTVEGTVNVNGTVSAGESIGALMIDGDFLLADDAVLEIEFGPTGQNDMITVTGSAVVDGTLDLFLADQNIAVGDVFTILTAGDGVTGVFDDINNINGFGQFEVTVNANDVTIEVLNLGGCIQTGSNVLCTDTDPNGFENTAQNGLDVLVVADAIVNNPSGNGLTLADDNTIDNQGTIDVAGDGINAGSGNIIKNSSPDTIIAGGDGISAGDNSDITNTGTITAAGFGILAGVGNNADLDMDGRAGIVNEGTIDAETGISVDAFNSITNAASGEITADDIGIFGVARNTIVNDGLIESGDDGIVVGIDVEGEGLFFILDGGNTVTNNGTIIAADDGIVAHSFDNLINNTSDLTVTAGDDAVDITGEGNVLNNAGTLTGGTAGGGASHGVDITGDMNTVTNTGTIASLSAAAVNAEGDGILVDNAGGTITGGGADPLAVEGGAGGQTVLNRMGGLLEGDVSLGADDDRVSLETGSNIVGDIDLGEDEGDTDTDIFELTGAGEDSFDGGLAGAELLEKTGAGTFDLNGVLQVDGVVLTREVQIDNDGDGVADGTVQVFDRVIGTTVAEGRLNVGGLILFDDDMDPATDPVLGPNTGATLTSPSVDVQPGGTLGGHGTVVTDPALLGGVFVSGEEASPLTPSGNQGVIAPGTSIGILNVVGRVVFDSVETAVIDDHTVITNNGGRFQVDLNDGGDHDLLNITAAGIASAEIGVPNDTTGPDGAPDGLADSVDVEAVLTGDGTATLGGTIDLVLDPEFADAEMDGMPDVDDEGNWIPTADYSSEARVYDVLIAENGVDGTFDNASFGGGPNDGGVTIREDNPATPDVDESNRAQLFKGSLDYLSDRVRIISIPDFAPDAVTGNQTATANYVDGFTQYGLNDDPLHALVAQIGVSGDVPGSLDDLHQEWFNAFNEVGINASRTIMHQASMRSHEVRGGRRGSKAISINVTDNSVTGASGNDNRASFWLAGDFAFVDVDSNNGFIEYDFDTVSGYGGIDYLVADNILVGLAGGFGNSDVDFAGRSGEGDIDSWQIAGYASIFGPEWFAELSGGVGGMDIESTRDVTFGTVNLTALADYDGDLSYVGGRGGYQFNLGNGFQITPTVALTYAKVEQDSFSETGAGTLNLVVDEQSFESLRLEGVVRIAKAMRTGNGGWVTPYASLGVGHEFEDDARAMTGGFQGVPGSSFTVFGDVPRKTTALFGAGISAMVGEMLLLYLDYSGEIGGDYQDHAISGGAKLRF